MDIEATYSDNKRSDSPDHRVKSTLGKWMSNSLVWSKIHPLTSVKPSPSKFNRRQTSYDEDPDCFHCAIGSILFISQFCGLFPMTGVRAKSVNGMKFRKLSFRFVYACFILISMCFMTCRGFDRTFKLLLSLKFSSSIDNIIKEITDAAVSAVFYGSRLLSHLLFLKICPGWIAVQHKWRAMERKLDEFKCKRPRLRRKFKIIGIVLLILGLVEHVLYLTSLTLSLVYDKKLSGNHTIKDWFYYFVHKEHDYVLKYEYFSNILYALFLISMRRVGLFAWYFIDLFVMLVAVAIADRYKYLNKRILEASEQELFLMDWEEVRKCYAVLSTLVKKVDNEVSGIIFLYYCCNIYFIYSVLMFINAPGLKDYPLTIIICNTGAFMILVVRSVCVTLTVARINDECQVIGTVLYNCPKENYTSEAQRLQHQIANDNVVLTGYQFFSITRSFLLAVAGAIITFQYVV